MRPFVIILFLLCGKYFAAEPVKIYLLDTNGILLDSSYAEYPKKAQSAFYDKKPNPIIQLIHKKQKKNKKIVAAILAFPFPFGIVGLHRIYLGTAPYVPVVYIASLGGVFGILPFIDFCVILLDKDFERYNHNNKVFMWVND